MIVQVFACVKVAVVHISVAPKLHQNPECFVFRVVASKTTLRSIDLELAVRPRAQWRFHRMRRIPKELRSEDLVFGCMQWIFPDW